MYSKMFTKQSHPCSGRKVNRRHHGEEQAGLKIMCAGAKASGGGTGVNSKMASRVLRAGAAPAKAVVIVMKRRLM